MEFEAAALLTPLAVQKITLFRVLCGKPEFD